MDTNTLLAQASRAALSGNKPQAQAILAELIRREPKNESAWLLLADIVEKKEYAVDCLERALRLNPGNEQARKRLEELKHGPGPQVQRVFHETIPQPVQSPLPKVTIPSHKAQVVPVTPQQTTPTKKSIGQSMKWAIMGTFALLICSASTVGSILVWRNLNAVPSRPVNAVAIITPATALAPLPPSPTSAVPTFPPEWTATPEPSFTPAIKKPLSTSIPKPSITPSIPKPSITPVLEYVSAELGDLCNSPGKYTEKNISVRGQVIQFDYFSDSMRPYTQIQVGDIYAPSSLCTRKTGIIPVVIFFDSTLPKIEPGIVVIVQGVGNGTVTGQSRGEEITAPWVIGDYIEPDGSCNVSLVIHHNNPSTVFVLDRLRTDGTIWQAKFDSVCPGPHTLGVVSGGNYSIQNPDGSQVVVPPLIANETSISIPESVSVWEIEYSSGFEGGQSLPGGGVCYNCP